MPGRCYCELKGASADLAARWLAWKPAILQQEADAPGYSLTLYKVEIRHFFPLEANDMKRLIIGLVAMPVVVLGVMNAEADSHSEGMLLGSMLGQLQQWLQGIIVMTEGECAALGEGWQPYGGLAGRFPIGAGQAEDARGDKRTFGVGDSGGAYLHQLTIPEMPSHRHPFHGSRGERSVDDWDNEWGHRNHGRETGSVGGDQPHNNMPPYRVVNFCHLATQPE